MVKTDVIVHRLGLGPLDNFVYVVADPESREAAAIDPAWDVDAILGAAEARVWRITTILATHHHHDHVNGLRALQAKTGARVFVGAEDAAQVRLLAAGVRVEEVADGAVIPLGGRVLRALATPGHTAGSRSFLVDGRVFTGDTLFLGACGRCDLEDSSPRAMFDSLTRVLAALPDDTLVHPGHNYDDAPEARLGSIRRSNPVFGFAQLRAFTEWVKGPRWPDEEE